MVSSRYVRCRSGLYGRLFPGTSGTGANIDAILDGYSQQHAKCNRDPNQHQYTRAFTDSHSDCYSICHRYSHSYVHTNENSDCHTHADRDQNANKDRDTHDDTAAIGNPDNDSWWFSARLASRGRRCPSEFQAITRNQCNSYRSAYSRRGRNRDRVPGSQGWLHLVPNRHGRTWRRLGGWRISVAARPDSDIDTDEDKHSPSHID